MSIQIQELAERYGTAWAAHDLDAIMAMHTEDTVFHLHGGGEASVGPAATRAAFAAAASQWPDIRFVKTRVQFGDGHFVSDYQMSATADGTPITCDGVDVIAVGVGRIARKDTYLDWPAIQQQLGSLDAMSLIE